MQATVAQHAAGACLNGYHLFDNVSSSKSGPCFSIKMVSYQYMDNSHVKGKTAGGTSFV